MILPISSGVLKLDGVGNGAGGSILMADLHGMLAAVFLVGGAHALGVIHGERHGLFLIDMLAGGDGGGEVLAVQVLRRGDQDRVDVLVFEQAAIIEVRLGVRALCFLTSSRRRV